LNSKEKKISWKFKKKEFEKEQQQTGQGGNRSESTAHFKKKGQRNKSSWYINVIIVLRKLTHLFSP
jgi:hypothetical protein